MALWMQQCQVVGGIRPSMAAPDDVMDMPVAVLRYRLVADWTAPVLCFPELEALALTMEGRCHLHVQTMLEVDFPCRVVGIGVST